jgi:hypothetical protein
VPDTRTVLQRQLAIARAREAEARAETEALEAAIAKLTAAREQLAALERGEPLQPVDDGGTLVTQMQYESAGYGRSAAQFDDSSKSHKFVEMLQRKRISVGDVAKFLKTPRATVQAWYKDPENAAYRAIPRESAEAIKAEYGVPISAWHRIREPK